jgi:ribosomal protein S18 acetylase RimI-like enzyme
MLNNLYIAMICLLGDQADCTASLPPGYEVRPLTEAHEADLYQCYYAAFQNGDAQFFFHQPEDKRRYYFDSLCLEDARVEPGSLIICKNEAVVGFTFVLPYGETNRHISCMCVHPDHQRQGLGEFMLHHALQAVGTQGYKSITLGTERSMGAFQLYRKYGFKILEDEPGEQLSI